MNRSVPQGREHACHRSGQRCHNPAILVEEERAPQSKTAHHTAVCDALFPLLNRGGERLSNYDEQAKRELVEACLQPGISVAGMALRHGVVADLLRNWTGRYRGILELWGRF